jgi:hypothetical protein
MRTLQLPGGPRGRYLLESANGDTRPRSALAQGRRAADDCLRPDGGDARRTRALYRALHLLVVYLHPIGRGMVLR